MFVTLDLYLKRIIHSLEKVVAPEIESDQLRGQIYAAANLLQQLSGTAEFKPELRDDEARKNLVLLDQLIPRLKAAAGPLPEPLAAALTDARADQPSALEKTDEALCRAIEWFFATRRSLPPATAAELDALIRDHLTKSATRDIGLIKPPNIEKISRSRRGQ